jgi:hypothetical protein
VIRAAKRSSIVVLAGAVIALAFVLAGGRADARRVVRMPTLRDLCPGNAEWAKVAECLKRQVVFKLAHDDARVKLVHVPGASRFGGLYVYSFAKQWQLRGELRLYEEHDVLAFQRVTLGKYGAYRLDAGVSAATTFSFDGETSVPAVLRQQITLLCFDTTLGCTQVMTACDLMLSGKAYYSFRGKVVFAAHELKVVGDRRNAGNYCVQPELVLTDD